MWFVEQHAETSEASRTQERDQILATHDSAAVKELSEELIDSSVNIEIANPSAEFTSSSPGNGHPDASFSITGSSSVKQFDFDIKSVAKFNHQSEVPESTPQHTVNSFVDSNKKLSKFEATAAEAELDMLLDSLTDIKILDSSGLSSADTRPGQEAASVIEFQLPRKNPDSSLLTTANLDDDLDDLLHETSGLMNQANLIKPHEENHQFVQSSFSQSGTKSKALDDFDSWLDTL